MRYENVLRAILTTPWAIRPDKLEEIAAFISLKMAGRELPEMHAETRDERRGGGVAVLPIFGTITQRANIISKYSGGTSTEQMSKTLRAAVNDPGIASIVLDVDSPGGTVFGVEELAREIFAAREQKPVVAVANSQAASAAYWLASQATEVVVTPGGEVGSIGVLAMHDDYSRALDKAGVTTTMITAGKYKGEGWPEFPLSADARDYIQARVDDYYDMFIKAVARGRSVGVKEVREGFGEGRMVLAQEAVKLGMADKVATLDDTIDRQLRRSVQRGSRADTKTVDMEVEQRRIRLLTLS